MKALRLNLIFSMFIKIYKMCDIAQSIAQLGEISSISSWQKYIYVVLCAPAQLGMFA